MCASADSRIFAVAKKRGRKKNSKVDYEKHRLADQPTWQVSCNPELSPRLDRPAAVAPTVPDDQESDAIQLLLAVASGDADAMPAIEDGSDSSEEEDSSEEDSSSEEEEEEAIQEWGDTSRGEIARARKEKQPSAAVQDIMLHVDDMLSCANAQYAEEFVWSERKLMAVRAYYACLKLQLPVLTATDVARHAANTDERTVRYWVADFENNHGWFSASLWGTNTKTPSLMADVEHRLWARQWVIHNMGHRNTEPNKRAIDFQKASHEHFDYDFDPVNPIISLRCATQWLHTVCGASYDMTKKGVFVDGHGKEHVIQQRKRFIGWYREVYNRGPNFVNVNGKMVDKDRVMNLLQSGLTNDHRCVGPRFIKLGGMRNSSDVKPLSFVPQHIDRLDKMWITVCHDECCVHTNEGEAYCWKIPGIEMGECPPKSKGDIIHLADANAELGAGTFSLVGELGMITRKEMRNYIQAKCKGREVKVPTYNTVWMHAGSSGDGYWTGEDAMMQFELMCDIFDLVFNMPHIIDLTKATSKHVLSITVTQRRHFRYGLCCQIDRSQNHLRRPPDGLNTKIGKGINKGTAAGQPHFRSTRAPLPAGYTHWAQCKQRLCKEDCEQCEVEVQKYGHHPDFQSQGKKGTNRILAERGLGTLGLLPEQTALLNSQPDWGQMKSHAIEIFEDRFHTCIIGAAYHAELASEEHRWRRLKQLVRPFVDGTVLTCQELISGAWGSLDGQSTFEDARSCRETMSAYKALEEAGLEVSLPALSAEYNKVKHNHRGVYDTQKDQLMCLLEMPQTEQQKKNAKTVENRAATKKVRSAKLGQCSKKVESQIRAKRNKAAASTTDGRASLKRRHKKHKEKGGKKYKRPRKSAQLGPANIFSNAFDASTDPNDV